MDVIYSAEVEKMTCVAKGPNHGPAPIPQEGKWTRVKEVRDISGLTHGVGWCAPQQGACKLTLNVKDGLIEEALVETLGCSGMTHSAAMAAEILPGKTVLEALKRKAAQLPAEWQAGGRYVLFSRSGFTEALREREGRGEVTLVGLHELYGEGQ